MAEEQKELLARLRRVEIRARGLSHQIFAGEYHSAFKGRGMAFSEVREYRYGDDVRNIDWNVTARFNQPYIKVFEEERELTVMLLVDVSGSRLFGTELLTKKNVMTEVAAILAFSAIQNNDKIGVILFSDRVEQFIPPKKGRKHILRIIWELMSFQPTGKQTDVGGALRYLTNAIRKRCTTFLLSDFLDYEGEALRFTDALNIASNKHDMVGLRVYDPREVTLPNVGLLRLGDAETGRTCWIDSGDAGFRARYHEAAVQREADLQRAFLRAGVDWVNISTAEDYVYPLVKLFKQRG
ncbi:MAG: hypothetical protein AL399_07030 [Candidatus [Bacteroides] periocalifornicus]|uniref:DUF58 domain-containing protein n=1 Tax=Candidatus [Bacteroides] periocalifornicus TaxID=1702214 RepID=A0A0Q4B6X6_9BACT|nr:MAG: hypothetical protein AL399_07030 [Candidatus [Bacteroides] periocalifornicus]